jgi:Linalool dehydratase/isomerase
MQSILNSKVGPSFARRRRLHTVLAYAAVLLLAAGFVSFGGSPSLRSLGLGLAFPGGGFLCWVTPDASVTVVGLQLCFASLVLFGGGLVLWIATGNVVLPVAVWLGSAFAAAGWAGPVVESARTLPDVVEWLPIAMLTALASASLLARWFEARLRQWHRQFIADTSKVPVRIVSVTREPDACPEISVDDLGRLRLLLDRALQPPEQFNGFEWIDQFQTAAVRYQINFMSYALSVASYSYLPAFQGYMGTAQQNLLVKQLDHRVWRYWALENLWGNLSRDGDPIARDNIMYSGFLAGQLSYARSGGLEDGYGDAEALAFEAANGTTYRYCWPQIVERLADRYQAAPYGLLACEPNWIYPLCNIMTASAICAADAQRGTRHWEQMEDKFRRHLQLDFTSADGRLLAFRSSITGHGSPAVGGAILQALPCFFLNSICPDLAQQQWQRVRHDLTGPHQRRFLWPVDVGNYRYSRASSYAGTAAAAVEMGDTETAARLLALLDAECPSQHVAGVAHRATASLWSHAVELMARLGHADAFRSMVTRPHGKMANAPYIKHANYSEVLVAAAHARSGTLRVVLYPTGAAGYKSITLAGLNPSKSYVIDALPDQPFAADNAGEAHLCLPVAGRTMMHFTPQT